MLYILERNTLLEELNIISLMVNMHGVVVTGTLASQIGRALVGQQNSDFTGKGELNNPLFNVLKSSVKTLMLYKTCLYSFKLHCLYI